MTNSASKNIDTIIVGFGLAGSVFARQLQQKGFSFTIFDSNENKASLVAAGMYNPIVFRRLVKSWMVDEILPCATQFYNNLESDLDIQFHFPTRYYKLLNADEVEFWQTRSIVAETQPYLSSFIETFEHSRSVFRPENAAQVNHAGWVDIPKMLRGYEKNLKDKGQIRTEKFEYDQLEMNDKGIKYKGINARNIIFCEGSSIAGNPYFSYLPFKPTKGEVLTIKSEKLQSDSIVNKDIFILPLGGDLYRVGATYEWKFLTQEPSDEGRNNLIKKLNAILRVPYVIVEHKAGIRPTSNDRRPILGSHPVHKNLFVFNGLGTKGIMLAPFFSDQLLKYMYNEGALRKEVDVARYYKFFQ